MNYQHFKADIGNKIATVAFNRPEKANALNMDSWKEMQSIFETLSKTEEVRGVVLTGGDAKHFSAGIDLELLMSVGGLQNMSCGGRRAEKVRDMVLVLQATVSSIEKCAKPVLAAVHSGCIGGAVDIITACDMRYCSEDTYFTVKEIDMGMVADLGTLQRLPKVISPGMAAEMAYTGRNVSGKEAEKIGLVNNCFDSKESMLDGVMEIAASIAAKSPVSIRGTKDVLRYSRDHGVEDGLNYMSTWNAGMLLSEDLMEAFKASMEKRKPEYND